MQKKGRFYQVWEVKGGKRARRLFTEWGTSEKDVLRWCRKMGLKIRNLHIDPLH